MFVAVIGRHEKLEVRNILVVDELRNFRVPVLEALLLALKVIKIVERRACLGNLCSLKQLTHCVVKALFATLI